MIKLKWTLLTVVVFLTMIMIETKAMVMNESTAQSLVFNPQLDGKWIGLGIAYGPYREGQSPQAGSVPSEQEILEDLQILTGNESLPFHLIRMYGSDGASEQVLKTIQKHKLPVRVMQGAWLSGNHSVEENNREIDELIRLATTYPDIIVALNLGNEIFVDWSHHKFEPEQIPMYLEWVNQVRAATDIPITLADDYNFYNKPWSKPVADALDFIVLHAYAMWNSQTLENAVSWTAQIYEDIQKRYPDKQIVLGESGWTTSSDNTNGDERLIIGEASERAQSVFFSEYRDWLNENKIANFYFQAFDEKWKGGEDKPDIIAEKNWGIYTTDRKPKQAVIDYINQ